jgi:hypothetical protein
MPVLRRNRSATLLIGSSDGRVGEHLLNTWPHTDKPMTHG